MNLLLRKAVEKFDNVGVRDFQRFDRCDFSILDDAAKRLGSGNGGSAAERQVTGFDDLVFERVFVPLDTERELERIATGNRTVFADPVRIFYFAQMGSRLPMNRIEEQLFCFFAIFPTHREWISSDVSEFGNPSLVLSP